MHLPEENFVAIPLTDSKTALPEEIFTERF